MGLLGKLLNRPAEPEALIASPCTHRILIARWDRPEDIGHEELAIGYKCEACDELFTPAMGRELLSLA
jgi:hypothetical protein